MSKLGHESTSHLLTEVAENKKGLRVVERTIVSAYVLSTDDYLLLGRQDASKGGTFPTAWRIPGGGIRPKEDGRPQETPLEAMVRELGEEVDGLILTPEMVTPLPITASLAAEKTLSSGEVVWQEMDLRHFEVRLDEAAEQLAFLPGDDLIELGWFSREVRAAVELIPVGRALMLQGGYIDPSIEI